MLNSNTGGFLLEMNNRKSSVCTHLAQTNRNQNKQWRKVQICIFCICQLTMYTVHGTLYFPLCLAGVGDLWLTCCWCCLAGCWGGRWGPGPPGRLCPLLQRAAPCAETLMAFGSVWDTWHGLQAGIRHTQGGRHKDTETGCTRSMHPHGGAIGKLMAVGS